MTLGEHLEELRTRIVRMLLAVAAGFALAFWRIHDVMHFIRRPLDRIAAAYGDDWVVLTQQKAYDAFAGSMKAAFFAGCVVSAPVIVHQLWAFVGAGLYPRERRSVKYYALPGFLLFFAGAALAYFYVMPFALDFLVWWSKEKMGAKSWLNLNDYVSLIAFSMFVFGLVFQVPLIMVFLMRIGVVLPATFRRYRRHAMVTIFVMAAILTPPDVLSQLVLAACLVALYEGAILVGARVSRPRKKEA